MEYRRSDETISTLGITGKSHLKKVLMLISKKSFGQKYSREYHARYDLTFVVSSGRKFRRKVRRRGAGRKIQPAQNLILYPNSLDSGPTG